MSSPHSQLFYFNESLEFCEFIEWKIKNCEKKNSQLPLLIFTKGANISGRHCIYILLLLLPLSSLLLSSVFLMFMNNSNNGNNNNNNNNNFNYIYICLLFLFFHKTWQHYKWTSEDKNKKNNKTCVTLSKRFTIVHSILYQAVLQKKKKISIQIVTDIRHKIIWTQPPTFIQQQHISGIYKLVEVMWGNII